MNICFEKLLGFSIQGVQVKNTLFAILRKQRTMLKLVFDYIYYFTHLVVRGYQKLLCRMRCFWVKSSYRKSFKLSDKLRNVWCFQYFCISVIPQMKDCIKTLSRHWERWRKLRSIIRSWKLPKNLYILSKKCSTVCDFYGKILLFVLKLVGGNFFYYRTARGITPEDLLWYLL